MSDHYNNVLEEARKRAEDLGAEVTPSVVALTSESVSGFRDPETARWFALLDALDFMYQELRASQPSKGSV